MLLNQANMRPGILLFFVPFFFAPCLMGQSGWVTLTDWTEYTFQSKYDNPITVLWQLKRSNNPTSSGSYKYLLGVKSKTSFNGRLQTVYIGVTPLFVDGKEKSIGAMCAYVDEAYTTWFYHESPNLDFNFKCDYGWIGTFLEEVEGHCQTLIETLDNATASDAVGMVWDANSLYAKGFSAWLTRKGLVTSAKVWKVATSKAFGALEVLLSSSDAGPTGQKQYKKSHDDIKEHVVALEQSYVEMDKLVFENWPPNELEERKLELRIEFSKKQLEKALTNFNVIFSEQTKMNWAETSLNDCQKEAISKYHSAFVSEVTDFLYFEYEKPPIEERVPPALRPSPDADKE